MEEQDWSFAGVLAGLSGFDHLAAAGREVDCFWLLVVAAAVVVVAVVVEKSAVQDRCFFHLYSSY